MRVRNKPWAEGTLQANPDIVITEPKNYRGKWWQFFDNNLPIHLEIGAGKGQFITDMAQQHPDINYIGLELQTSVIVSALQKIKEVEIDNVALLNQNAQDLQTFFAPGELERIYLNFSDPWPKKRHAKRRLTHPSFLSIYQQVLAPQGEIHIKTDNEGLFEFSLNSLADFGCRLKKINFDLHQSEFTGNIMTEYEEKFAQRGQKIFRCEAVMPACGIDA